VAITEKLQRAQTEAAEKVYGMFTGNEFYLKFCLLEAERPEKDVDGLHMVSAEEKNWSSAVARPSPENYAQFCREALGTACRSGPRE
jgi:hypothetical protein